MLRHLHAQPFDPVAAAAYPNKPTWEKVSDDLLDELLTRWKLTAHGTHGGGRAGLVVEVTREDGTPAVLKIGVPHNEGRWEAVALQAFPEGTAPKLYKQDPSTWSQLLERIIPGTPLRDAHLPVEEALRRGGELHGLIASSSPPDTPLPRVADYATGGARRMRDSLRHHAADLARLGIATEPLERAADELERLAVGSTAGALVHGDLNPGNIVYCAERDRWVIIDPKGMIGDPAFDLAPLVSQLGSPLSARNPAKALTRQLLIAADAAGCDARRAAEWGYARAGQITLMFVEDGDDDLAVEESRLQEVWRRVVEKLS